MAAEEFLDPTDSVAVPQTVRPNGEPIQVRQ